MIKSMTGFGKGEATFQNKKITVEIRSLNSKQLDLNLRLPSVYRQSEYELRTLIARTVQRGKVDVFVNVESQRVETPARINRELFREYLRQMNDTLAYAGIDADYDTLVPAILRMPEVVSAESETVSDEEHAALLSAAEAAAAHLDAFRAQEGAILIADLLRRVDLIEQYKEEVVPFEQARTQTIRARILDNLAQLKVDVDSNRLEQEMIFYLEKLDITEEKVRLTNHCRYFREVAAGEEGVGRKLGFIAQEMGREINTMGSKANETNIQILVVKMKDELEKIKEQVLNIL
jgi:TIGR00255 family protein